MDGGASGLTSSWRVYFLAAFIADWPDGNGVYTYFGSGGAGGFGGGKTLDFDWIRFDAMETIQPGNASTYIANAAIGVAHINTASIGSLSALSANMGTVTIDSAGHVKGGQTAYSTGTGFFLGYSSGAYRFSIGNPAGAQLTWDGTDLRLTGQVFGSMSIAAISDIGGTVSAGTNKLLGSRTATVTGGTGTLTYRWVILSQNNNPSTRSCYLSSYTSATVYVYINSIANSNETDVAVMCTVTDSNGRVAVQQFTVGVLGV